MKQSVSFTEICFYFDSVFTLFFSFYYEAMILQASTCGLKHVIATAC